MMFSQSHKMNFFQLLFFCLLLLKAQVSYAHDALENHSQLLVVTSQNWVEMKGSLQRFERPPENNAWIAIGEEIPVMLGKAGLAWGIGLQPFPINRALPLKREGDLKSPAGIFSIGKAFGFSSYSEMSDLKIDYLYIDDSIEAVDDPLSQYYNCIVDNLEVSCDWQYSEKMAEISLYELGFVVQHNFPNPQAEAGSAIFIHIWRNEKSGTAGCTAMSYENLHRVVSWLDKNKKSCPHPTPQSPLC